MQNKKEVAYVCSGVVEAQNHWASEDDGDDAEVKTFHLSFAVSPQSQAPWAPGLQILHSDQCKANKKNLYFLYLKNSAQTEKKKICRKPIKICGSKQQVIAFFIFFRVQVISWSGIIRPIVPCVFDFCAKFDLTNLWCIAH